MNALNKTFATYSGLSPQSVTNLKDIGSFLNTREQDPTKMVDVNEDTLTNWIFDQLGQPKGGKYTWQVGGMKTVIDGKYSTNEQALKDEIRKKIVPQICTRLEKVFKSRMTEFIQKVNDVIVKNGSNNSETSMMKIAEDTFGKGRFADHVVKDLSFYLGLQYKVQEVLPYSKLYTHSDPNVRKLFVEGMEGLDPLVILHNTKDGKVDFSLVDVTSKPLGERMGGPIGRGLFSELMSDSEFRSAGGSDQWAGKAFNMRNLMLTMQLMSMKDANPDISLRNIGTLELHGNQIKPFMINDLSDALNTVNILKSNTVFSDNLKNEMMEQFLNKNKLYTDNYNQSWVSQLNSFIKQQADNLDIDLPGNYAIQDMAEKQSELIFGGEVTSKDLLDIYQKRQKVIEQKLGMQGALNDPEYRLIANATKEIKVGNRLSVNNLKDMTWLGKKLLNSYNVSSDVLQWVIGEAQVAKNIITDKFIDYHKAMRPLFKSVVDDYMSRNPKAYLSREMRDKGSDYFADNMRKGHATLLQDTKIDGKDYKAGDKVDVKLPYMAMSMDDAGVSTNFTQTHMELNQKVNEILKQRAIDDMYADMIRKNTNLDAVGKPTITKEYVKNMVDENWVDGMVNVIGKSISELITTGDMKRGGDVAAGFSKMGTKMRNEGDFFTDAMGANTDKELGAVRATFKGQYDENSRLLKAGLRKKANGDYEVLDYNLNHTMSTNLERIVNYTMLDGMRTETYNDRLMPVVNDANAIFQGLNPKINQKNNIDYLKQFIDKVVYRKNADGAMDGTFDFMGKTYHASAITRVLVHAYSNSKKFLSPIVTVNAQIYNELNMAVAGMSRSISNIGVPLEMRDIMPSGKDYMNAHAAVFKDGDFRKARMMALNFQIVNRTERDLLESPTLNLSTAHNKFTEGTGYIALQFGDMGSRILAMTAWMMHEGSWDAYSFDKKSGAIGYDIKKDTRYYNPDGTQTLQQAALERGLRSRLEDQGLMKAGDPVPQGHDWTMINNNLKWIGDKWVVGGVDEMTKPLLSNSYIGALFSTFRLFSMDPMYNVGANAGAHKSVGGSQYVASMNEHGDYISTLEQRDIEGVFQSVGHALNDAWSLKNIPVSEWGSFNDWWVKQKPQARFNMANGMVRLFVWSVMFAAVKGIVSKKDESKFNSYLSDVTIVGGMTNWAQNPIPMASGLVTMMSIASGKEKLSGLSSFTAGPGNVYNEFLKDKRQDKK